MIEMYADIWDLYDAGEVVCITTNGYVKPNGEAVMGRGVARQAVDRFPDLPMTLGALLGIHGNCVLELLQDKLVSFPVKPREGIAKVHNVVRHMRHRFRICDRVPGWAMVAEWSIIGRSLDQLARLRELRGWEKVYLPRPGCGAGELDWEKQVKPMCAKRGDWLVVMDRPVPI